MVSSCTNLRFNPSTNMTPSQRTFTTDGGFGQNLKLARDMSKEEKL
jgi:hypothetical protein